MTDGWLPVIKNNPPFAAGAHEWQYRIAESNLLHRAQGSVEEYVKEGMFIHIVAIRRLDTSTKSAQITKGSHPKNWYPSKQVLDRAPSMPTNPQKVDTSAERVQENEKSVHENYCPQCDRAVCVCQSMKPIYRQIGQNEMMAIAGWAMNCMERNLIEVDVETARKLGRDW